jgi:hypothetical protein
VQSSNSTRACVDTCIISGLAKEDLPRLEQEALYEILRLHKAGACFLMPSEVAKEEIERLPPAVRGKHDAIYSLLSNVPTAPTHATDGGFGIVGGHWPQRQDPLLNHLMQILPDRKDAEHLFQAAKSNVSYFITTDQRTILRFSAELKDKIGITAVLPSQFTAALHSQGGAA